MPTKRLQIRAANDITLKHLSNRIQNCETIMFRIVRSAVGIQSWKWGVKYDFLCRDIRNLFQTLRC